MRYSRLGSSGLVVSRLGLGMMSYGDTSRRPWHLDADQARPLVRTAVEAGVTLFDTADMYDLGESERVTGRLLAEFFADRDDYVLATKAYFPMGDGPNAGGLSRKHLLSAIDGSLKRLGVDHVDLFQIHRFDPAVPIEETLDALNDIVRSGKARYLGASSMFAWQFARMQYTARHTGLAQFTSMQNHYNLLYREEEREMIPLCKAEGVGVLPYSPLARGMLTGSRSRAERGGTSRGASDPLADATYTDDDFDVVDAVNAVAESRGVPPAQVALAWVMNQDGITAPLVGATKPAHIADAIAAVDLELDVAECEQLEAQYRPHPVLGHD
ncbi:aldo/keto reductase [Diaminobutyricibacter sp. McL0608]|uniref:aldo/keto reductase n=1 Tax=Leifsonia sp. McL0608 TaxID=3143537 RepID=UPI0031F2E5BD